MLFFYKVVLLFDCFVDLYLRIRLIFRFLESWLMVIYWRFRYMWENRFSWCLENNKIRLLI